MSLHVKKASVIHELDEFYLVSQVGGVHRGLTYVGTTHAHGATHIYQSGSPQISQVISGGRISIKIKIVDYLAPILPGAN